MPFLTLFLAFLLISVALSYVLPFLKANPSITVAQSRFRILLVFVLMIAVPLALAFVPLSRAAGYVDLPQLWAGSKVAGIFFIFSMISFLLVGLIIPLSTVSYFRSGYRKLMQEHRSANVSEAVLKELQEIFSEALQTTQVEASIKMLVANDASLVSDCGIVGRGRNAAMLLSPRFIDFYQNGSLAREDVKAIFLHELSHVLHKDHFMPLWALWFVRSKVFTYTIVVFMAAIVFVFLSGYIAETFDMKENLMKLAWLFVGVPIVFVVFRTIIYRLIARIMREREFLADAHSAYFYARDKMAAALRKSALLPAQESFAALSFTGLGKAEWHPSIMSRIEALGQKKEPEPRLAKMPSALQMLSYCAYFILFLASLFVIGAVLPGMARYITPLGWVLSFLAVTTLVIENIFPLRFLGRQSLVPFLVSRSWTKIHLNNFIIALTVCSLTALSSLVFPKETSYIKWHKTFFFRAVVFYFLYCTGLSVLLVAVYRREKKREKIEVPIEAVMKS